MNSLSRDVLKSFRHPLRGCRVHFLCLSKENRTKRKDTPRQRPLRGFVNRSRDFRQFILELTKTRARPVRAPFGPDRLQLTAAEGGVNQEPQRLSLNIARTALVLCALVVLTACERTRFSEAPADATGCNPALVGKWLSEATDDSPLGEVVVDVDASCQLRVSEHDREPARVSPPTALRSARVAGRDVLWIDAAWADQAFENEADAITPDADSGAHDVYLFAWQRDGRQLQLSAPDHTGLAHAAIDGEIKADVLHGEYLLHVRVREPQAKLQSLLAAGKLFGDGNDDSRTIHFVRSKNEP
ncbi:MAG: hypothetical protein R3F22_04095 [Lysobacteraceae bacterium]